MNNEIVLIVHVDTADTPHVRGAVPKFAAIELTSHILESLFRESRQSPLPTPICLVTVARISWNTTGLGDPMVLGIHTDGQRFCISEPESGRITGAARIRDVLDQAAEIKPGLIIMTSDNSHIDFGPLVREFANPDLDWFPDCSLVWLADPKVNERHIDTIFWTNQGLDLSASPEHCFPRKRSSTY
jgi:hypothetical protein